MNQLYFNSKLNRFVKLAALNENVKRNSVYVSLNFDPLENHSKEKLNKIADNYMNKIGFDREAYLVYQHHDAEHPHLNVVTNNIRRDGKRIDLHLLGIKKQSQKNYLKNTIDLAFFDKKINFPEQLALKLQKEGIHLVLEKVNKDKFMGLLMYTIKRNRFLMEVVWKKILALKRL